MISRRPQIGTFTKVGADDVDREHFKNADHQPTDNGAPDIAQTAEHHPGNRDRRDGVTDIGIDCCVIDREQIPEIAQRSPVIT